MDKTTRLRAEPLETLNSVTPAQHQLLEIQGRLDKGYWDLDPKPNAQVFDDFKAEVKTHYWWRQGGRCCYCSFPLQENRRTWDLEHIVDKSTHNALMFCLKNLAAACPTCNVHKGTKSPLANAIAEYSLLQAPDASGDYSIVHPHLDEWGDHLVFDEFGRIVAVAGSSKGTSTIAMCRIDKQNITRLAALFTVNGLEAQNLLRGLHSTNDEGERDLYMALLQELAGTNAAAKAVLAAL